MPSFLTRRVTFAAAHRYRIASWSDERNEATFGACARPNFHGHSYVCDVTVTGEVDPVTGFLVDLGALDRALQTEVRDRFDHSNINLDVAGVRRWQADAHGRESRALHLRARAGVTGECGTGDARGRRRGRDAERDLRARLTQRDFPRVGSWLVYEARAGTRPAAGP